MNFDASLAFLKTELEQSVGGRAFVAEGYVRDFVSNKSEIKDFLDEDLKLKLTRHLESIFWTTQEDGHSLTADITPWYGQRILQEDYESYYWRRLEKYWQDHAVIPTDSIRSTDKVTNEIMDFIGDPLNQEAWHRRGLVMGHVQAGKTTNYSALVAKAADAGYRIIIVLAGLTNSLRKQTQQRLDEAFVGRSSIGDELNRDIYPVARSLVGLDGYEGITRHPYCLTSQLADFSVEGTRNSTASEGNFADPILFVTKKNQSVLESLANWLGGLSQGGKIEGPILLIDDEADNASVNTASEGNSVSRINQRIREILKVSKRTTYIGYTATPFANIFIDPDSSDSMLDEDLFPRHFIKSLEPPTTYIGAKDLFADGAKFADPCVREIPDEDYVDLLPLKHKADHYLSELPNGLTEALIEYFLFRAIQVLSNELIAHSAMMINVSRFNDVQDRVNDLVEVFRRDALDATKVWAKSPQWRQSKLLVRMNKVWCDQFEPYCQFDWEMIRGVLYQAIVPVNVGLVNMKGPGLDSLVKRGQPLHVIAIGGLALSRGLTLNGLVVSYVLRNVGAADTLLQMGRWFGYRPSYEKLCRVHVTPEMKEHFSKISESVEELRDDLARMEALDRTPNEFGLKVRASETGIAITAANKMRAAEPVYLAADYALRHEQGFQLFDSQSVNASNLNAALKFYSKLEKLGRAGNYSGNKNALVWVEVDALLVIEFLRSINLPGMPFAIMAEGNSLLSDYISDKVRHHNELEKWVVAIPTSDKPDGRYGKRIELPFATGRELYCRQRFSGVRDNSLGNIVKVTSKDAVVDPLPTDMVYGESAGALSDRAAMFRQQDGKLKKERSYLKARNSPFLVVHPIQFSLKESEKPRPSFSGLESGVPVITVSVGLTDSATKCREHLYASSVRFMEQMTLLAEQSETDEELD